MCPKVTIVYNEPLPSKYWAVGEGLAICGVLDEVAAVHQALLALGYEVDLLPLQPPMSRVKAKLAELKSPLVFNLFEGFDGSPDTEAKVAYIMEELDLYFTGSPGRVLALAQNKGRAKQVLRRHGIPTADYQVLTPDTVSRFKLSFPCITKPLSEDASHGITPSSVVSSYSELEEQVKTVYQTYGHGVLVENFLSGREFNDTVIGKDDIQVMPPSEIIYALPEGKPQILTFSAKWKEEDDYFNGTRVKCPAPVEPEFTRQIQDIAAAAFRALSCRGYARVDMRQSASGQLMVLEVNPNPDLSPGMGAALQSQAAGFTYEQFIGKIMSLAIESKAGAGTLSAAPQ